MTQTGCWSIQTLLTLWASNQHQRSSQGVVSKSRSYSPLLVFFFLWVFISKLAHFYGKGDFFSPVSIYSLSRVILIGAAWVTWQSQTQSLENGHALNDQPRSYGEAARRVEHPNSPTRSTHSGVEFVFKERNVGTQLMSTSKDEYATTKYNYCLPYPPIFHSVKKKFKKKKTKPKPSPTSSKNFSEFGKRSIWVEPKSKSSTTLLTISLGYWCNWLENLQGMLAMLGGGGGEEAVKNWEIIRKLCWNRG